MARCPHCRRGFRVMEDEDDGQHDCPHCGYNPHDRYLVGKNIDLDTEEDYIRDRDRCRNGHEGDAEDE